MKEVSIKVNMTVPDNFDAKLFCQRVSGGDHPDLVEEFLHSVEREYGIYKPEH